MRSMRTAWLLALLLGVTGADRSFLRRPADARRVWDLVAL